MGVQVCQPITWIPLNFPRNSLRSALCPRIGTAIKERWLKERRRMRFIRTMKRNTGTREKMWAGHTAPFFACRKVKTTNQKRKKARKGPFYWAAEL